MLEALAAVDFLWFKHSKGQKKQTAKNSRKAPTQYGLNSPSIKLCAVPALPHKMAALAARAIPKKPKDERMILNP